MAEVVATPSFAPGYWGKLSSGSKAGTRYRTASGAIITNQSEDVSVMTFEVADVTKPLASAKRSTARGHRIVLDDDDAYIQTKHTDRNVKLHSNGNMFVMRAHMVTAKPQVTGETKTWTLRFG